MALTTNGPQVITLVAPQLGGSALIPFDCSPYGEFWVVAAGLQGAETVTVTLASPDGSNFVNMIGKASNPTGSTGLTATFQADVFHGGTSIRVQKGGTIAAVGIYLIPIRPTY